MASIFPFVLNLDDERHGCRSNSASSATTWRSCAPTQPPGTEMTWQNNKRWKTSSVQPSPSDQAKYTTFTMPEKRLQQPVEQMETEVGNEDKRPIKNALNEETPFPVSALQRTSSDEELQLYTRVPKVQQQQHHCGMLQEIQPERAIKKKFHKLPAHAEFHSDDLTEPTSNRKLKMREGHNTAGE